MGLTCSPPCTSLSPMESRCYPWFSLSLSLSDIFSLLPPLTCRPIGFRDSPSPSSAAVSPTVLCVVENCQIITYFNRSSIRKYFYYLKSVKLIDRWNCRYIYRFVSYIIANEMLDLNLNFVNEDETTTFRDVEESGTSNSSVVNADGVNSSNAGEGDDDSSSAGGAGESFSCFNFDILKVGDAGVQSGNTYDEDRRSQNLTQSEFVTRHLFPMSHGHGGGEESGQQSNSLLLRPNTNELQEMRLVQVPQQKPTVQPNLAGKKSRRGPRSRSSQYRGVTFYRRTGRWESHIWLVYFIWFYWWFLILSFPSCYLIYICTFVCFDAQGLWKTSLFR